MNSDDYSCLSVINGSGNSIEYGLYITHGLDSQSNRISYWLSTNFCQVINIGFIRCEGKFFPNNMMVLVWKSILDNNFIITHNGVGELFC